MTYTTTTAPATATNRHDQHVIQRNRLLWRIKFHRMALLHPAIVRLAKQGRIGLYTAITTLDVAAKHPTTDLAWNMRGTTGGDGSLADRVVQARNTVREDRYEPVDPDHRDMEVQPRESLATAWGYHVLIPLVLAWLLCTPTTAHAAPLHPDPTPWAWWVLPCMAFAVIRWRGVYAAVAVAMGTAWALLASVIAVSEPVAGVFWSVVAVACVVAAPYAPQPGPVPPHKAPTRPRKPRRKGTPSNPRRDALWALWGAWLAGVIGWVVVAVVIWLILGAGSTAHAANGEVYSTTRHWAMIGLDSASFSAIGSLIVFGSLACLLISMISDSLPAWCATWWHGRLSRDVAVPHGFWAKADTVSGQIRVKLVYSVKPRSEVDWHDLPMAEWSLRTRATLFWDDYLAPHAIAYHVARVFVK